MLTNYFAHRPNNLAFQIFNPIGMVLGMAVLDRAFKDFHTLDEIFHFEPTLNDDAQILEWANPMRALPTAFSDVLNLLKQQLVLPTLESPSQGPPASEDNSTIPTFRPFAAPLSPCLTPSALIEEGSEALGLNRGIHEDIKQGRYECLICNKYIRPVSYIWSCQICCCVLHLSCIKKWLEVELSSEELDTMEDWHCPACTDQIEPPRSYNCWCGKQVEPHPLLGLPPHSCGQACSRVSVGLGSPGKSCCDRPCEFICHAGPCPPCGYKEPLQGISDQWSEDKSRNPRSKRTFGEMDESIISRPNDISKIHTSMSHPLH